MAFSSHGTLLKIGDGADPEVYATIAKVMDISGPSLTLATETVTSHDSGGRAEVIPTILDVGEVTFDINYTAHETQETLRTALENRTMHSFQIVFPITPETTATFDAYVTGFEFNAPVEGVLRASVTLSQTGPVNFDTN